MAITSAKAKSGVGRSIEEAFSLRPDNAPHCPCDSRILDRGPFNDWGQILLPLRNAWVSWVACRAQGGVENSNLPWESGELRIINHHFTSMLSLVYIQNGLDNPETFLLYLELVEILHS